MLYYYSILILNKPIDDNVTDNTDNIDVKSSKDQQYR